MTGGVTTDGSPTTIGTKAAASSRHSRRRYAAMRRFSYTNRLGQTYYLHATRATNRTTRYTMRRQAKGAVSRLPEGYEVRENIHARVSVRRIRKKHLLALEEKLLHTALERYRPFAYTLDIEGKAATVYASAEDRKCFLESLDADFADGFADALTKALAKRYSSELVEMFRARRKEADAKRPRYYPLLRFVVVDARARQFAVERVCFSGESSWIRLEVMGLAPALEKYLPHLGRDSFFDLI